MSNKQNRIRDVNWGRNLWQRVQRLITGLDERVTDLEEGGGGGGEDNVIEAISFNGANVPPDANKRVSMSETDPTVPSWAKQSSKPAYTASEVGALPANTPYVSGVKGNAESAFRSGNVTLNAANIGALAKGSYGNTTYIVRYLKNTDISEADNGVGTGTSIAGTLIGMNDDAENHILDLVGEAFKTGAIRYKFILRNIGASPVSFGGYVDLNKDGTATLFFSHPAAIRQALDIIEATTTHAGLMSAADKAKLDGFAPGGGDVTGVKGNAESTYRTGLVNLTPANIGALPDNTPIPSKTSDLTNDSGFLTSATGVTGVKGNAENNYRQGNVNLTPANIGAMKNAASGVSFGGSEAAYSTNIISMLDTMALYEGKIILTYANANTDNFINGSTYNGILYKLDQKFATGFLTNNTGSSILIYRSGNDTVNFKALTKNAVIPIGTGGTNATTPAGACANIGALRSFATSVAFSGSAANLYQNLEAQIDNMNDGEAKIFKFLADDTSGPFYQWHTYSGTFVRYANKTCSGIVSDQTGSLIVMSCNGGTWTTRSI